MRGHAREKSAFAIQPWLQRTIEWRSDQQGVCSVTTARTLGIGHWRGYSVRPRPEATVSTPVTWDEIEQGLRMEDFTIMSAIHRLGERGDLWRTLLSSGGRFNLGQYS